MRFASLNCVNACGLRRRTVRQDNFVARVAVEGVQQIRPCSLGEVGAVGRSRFRLHGGSGTRRAGDGVKKTCGLSKWHQTPAESGQIGGVTFLRIAFRGVMGKSKSRKARGFFYLTKDGGTSVSLSIMDAQPDIAESLELGTAAILTLRKKGADDAPARLTPPRRPTRRRRNCRRGRRTRPCWINLETPRPREGPSNPAAQGLQRRQFVQRAGEPLASVLRFPRNKTRGRQHNGFLGPDSDNAPGAEAPASRRDLRRTAWPCCAGTARIGTTRPWSGDKSRTCLPSGPGPKSRRPTNRPSGTGSSISTRSRLERWPCWRPPTWSRITRSR